MNQELNELYQTILERRKGDPETSYVARQFQKGKGKIAQKLGEEAVELVIAALAESRDHAVKESADLMFHTLMLWASLGIEPDEVMAVLRERKGISGIAEKARRKDD